MAGKFWREAASLMVVGRGVNLNSKVSSRNFEVLMLKRSKQSSFFANAYVFPGGAVEPSDFSESWLDVFKKCGHEPDDLQSEFRSEAPPSLYKNKSYPLLPEIGFRIGAIREAFEECGLLLARDFPYKDLSQQQLFEWQHIVHQDGSQFLKMFQELGGCPAVWNLHEWVTWLTPAHGRARRFDTAFYITFMEKIPQINVDEKEVVDVMVSTPQEILQQFARGDFLLPPPQIYELGRLLNFYSYEKLQKFASERGRKGMEQLFPVQIFTSSGVISVLPGDDLYPEDPDFSGEREDTVVQESMEELRKRGNNFHRMEMKSWSDIDLVLNVSPKCGHVVPDIKSIKHLKSKV